MAADISFYETLYAKFMEELKLNNRVIAKEILYGQRYGRYADNFKYLYKWNDELCDKHVIVGSFNEWGEECP